MVILPSVSSSFLTTLRIVADSAFQPALWDLIPSIESLETLELVEMRHIPLSFVEALPSLFPRLASLSFERSHLDVFEREQKPLAPLNKLTKLERLHLPPDVGPFFCFFSALEPHAPGALY
jgi:hypothetical protein